MPRQYKRKLGAPLRRQYSEDQVEAALEAVIVNNMSLRQASEQFNVPRNTIFRKYHGMNGDKLGRPPVLNPGEELQITKALTTAANFGYPFTENDLKMFVQHYLNNKGCQTIFPNNLPGSDWVKYFLARNQELSIRFSENIKRARADLSIEVLQRYFNNLQVTLEGVPPENILNYDESNLTDDPGKQRVFVRRGSKRASRILDSSKSSISVMFAASGDGVLLPPYVVYKAVNLYPEWILNGPEGTVYNRSTSGWFDSVLFEDWFDKIALPFLRRKEGVKVLIGDNLSSHISVRIIQTCEANNILFVLLPPNSTHLCQPLDVAVFRPMKIAWRKILTKWKLKHRGTVPKATFPSLLKELLMMLRPNLSSNIKSGFAASSIIPVDPKRVLNKVLGKPDDPSDNNALTQSFTEIIETRIGKEEKHTLKRKKKISVEPGQSVKGSDFNTQQEDIQELEEGETQEIEEGKIQEIEETQNKGTSSSFNVVPIARRQSTTFIRPENNCDNIAKNSFVLIKFIYNAGTKKQTEKKYVAQVLENYKTDQKLKVDCMRNLKEKKISLFFPMLGIFVQSIGNKLNSF